MKRFCGRFLICLVLLLCLCAGTALADLYQAYTLYDLHYAVPKDLDFERLKEDDGDVFLHMSETDAVGQGAVSATPVQGDYTGTIPSMFYREYAAELSRNGKVSVRSETTAVSGQTACLVYVTGDYFGLGEKSSASLVILRDDCCYVLTYYSPTKNAETEWRNVIKDVYIGSPLRGMFNEQTTEGTNAALKLGDQSEDVRTLQRRLLELGYLKGFANGRYTSITEDAVRAYQQDQGLPVSGECDATTLRRLDLPESLLNSAGTASVRSDATITTRPKATATPRPTATPVPTVCATPRKTKAPVVESEPATYTYIYNKNTKKFHLPNCRSVRQMKDKNKGYFKGTFEELVRMGYSPCKICLD